MATRTTKKSSRTRSTARSRTTAARRTTKSAAKPTRIAPTEKTRTKSEVYRIISDQTGVPRKQVQEVFETLGTILEKDLGRRGPGTVNVAGMMKVTVQRKPATKARKGINPFTGEPTTFKAKPARNVVKIRPLKALKELV